MVISHFLLLLTMLVGIIFVSCPNFRVFTQSGTLMRIRFYSLDARFRPGAIPSSMQADLSLDERSI